MTDRRVIGIAPMVFSMIHMEEVSVNSHCVYRLNYVFVTHVCIYMSVRICAYVCVCVHANLFVTHMCIHMCVRMCAYVCVCVHANLCLYTRRHTRMFAFVCLYVRACERVFICARVYFG